MLKTIGLILSIVVGLLSPAVAEKQIVRIGVVDFPPYINADSLSESIGIKKLNSIFAQTDFDFTVQALPSSRIAHYLDIGLLDAIFPTPPYSSPGGEVLYTDTIYQTEFLLVSSLSNPITAANMSENVIGGIAGWQLEVAMPDQAFLLVDNRKQFIPLLKVNRIQGFIDEARASKDNIATYDPNNTESYKLNEVIMPTGLSIGILKDFAHKQILVEQLNDAISKLGETD